MINQGTARNEVAVFIDFENLRYSLLNLYGLEPDFQSIVEKAKKYGRPSLMRAYADFSEHPQHLKQKLHIAGIEAINVNVKRLKRPGGDPKGIERVKNAADMILALDAVLEAADADAINKVKTFLLVTGDADYIKLVTQLKHRFGQTVIIAGVKGAIGVDLVTAAGDEDNIEVEKPEPVDMQQLKAAIVKMVRKGCSPLKYWSISTIDQWSQSPRQAISGTPKEKRDAIYELVHEGVLEKKDVDLAVVGKRGTATQVVIDEDKAKECKYLD